MARKKIALIGGGQIGGTLALFCAQKELGDVIVFDIMDGTAKGKALDIQETRAIYGYDVNLSGTNNWEDVAGADVLIVTAGLPRKPGMSRDDLLSKNIVIMKEVAENAKKYCPDAFNIILSNPLDIMVYTFAKITGAPKNKVVGMAGVLDSTRLKSFIAMELNCSVKDVTALVLGGHGDTMVPLLDYTTVSGIPVTKLIEKDKLDAIVARTRKAGGEIVGLLKTGSAFYSPAEAAVQMLEAYFGDQRRILPVAAWCTGQYGAEGIFMGVPAMLSAKGVEKVYDLELNDDDKANMKKTLEHVNKLMAELKNFGVE